LPRNSGSAEGVVADILRREQASAQVHARPRVAIEKLCAGVILATVVAIGCFTAHIRSLLIRHATQVG
jgi:hypothetical protein